MTRPEPGNGSSLGCGEGTPTCRASRTTCRVCGTPEDVVRGLREVKDAGAEMIVLNPMGADVTEDREQMERLVADVVPHLD